MHRPSEFKILEEKVAEFEKQKNEAIKEQKFEDAANYRDKERQTQQNLKKWSNNGEIKLTKIKLLLMQMT